MSTHISRPLHQFIVYAPDKIDEGTYLRRLSVREKHVVNGKELAGRSYMHIGGAMLSPESVEPGGEVKMVGSVLVFEAETIEEVRKTVESDIYYTSGVWDPAKLVILPFKLAVSSSEGLVSK